MELIKINERLLTATRFVRDGSRLADAGTDHAYLPIYLMQVGRITSAVATDINSGPIEIARKNIASCGFSGSISAIPCDGLQSVSPESVDDIAILGMGGELIARIIEDAPWLRTPEKRLILQPMTHPERLRAHLFSEGFAVIDEGINEDRGRIYQTLCVSYDGKMRVGTPLSLMFGEILLSRAEPLTLRQIMGVRGQIERRAQSMPQNSPEAIADMALLNEINTYLEEHKNECK